MLEFGDFQLDADRRILLRDGAPVAIQARLFDTLVFLAENRHRVVEKQELLEAVWPQTYVEESTLFQTISALRKSLGETKSDGARYVATVPGRGYRFVAHDEAWTGRKCSGNGNSLSLATGEFVRVSVQVVTVEAHDLE